MKGSWQLELIWRETHEYFWTSDPTPPPQWGWRRSKLMRCADRCFHHDVSHFFFPQAGSFENSTLASVFVTGLTNWRECRCARVCACVHVICIVLRLLCAYGIFQNRIGNIRLDFVIHSSVRQIFDCLLFFLLSPEWRAGFRLTIFHTHKRLRVWYSYIRISMNYIKREGSLHSIYILIHFLGFFLCLLKLWCACKNME